MGASHYKALDYEHEARNQLALAIILKVSITITNLYLARLVSLDLLSIVFCNFCVLMRCLSLILSKYYGKKSKKNNCPMLS